jgi:hypothetical protein
MLREQYICLVNYRLSQALFLLAKSICNLNNSLARLNQQLQFLSWCKSSACFPATIQNLHLPYCLQSNPKLSNPIKLMVLGKLRRSLFQQRATILRRLELATDNLRASIAPSIFDDIIQLAIREFQHQSSISHIHVRRKFSRLLRLQHSYSTHVNSSVSAAMHSGPFESAANTSSNNATPPPRLLTDLTSEGLSPEEKIILSNGPKFAISQSLSTTNLLEYTSAFQRLIYQVRWRTCNYSSGNVFPSLSSNKPYRNPPTHILPLEQAVRTAAANFFRVISRHSKFQTRPNLSKTHFDTIKRLREKNVTCLPSDKGGEFCIVDNSIYDKAIMEHLSDLTTYRKIARYNPSDSEKTINNSWSHICKLRNLPVRILRHFKAQNTTIPVFYGLIKTHKDGPNLKIRPIVNTRNGPCYPLTWLIFELIKHLLPSFSYSIVNSNQLCEKLNELTAEELSIYNYPVSLDIENMYTSIPKAAAIDVLVEKLRVSNFCFQGILAEDIGYLLSTVLNHSYFRFKNQTFKQIKGLAMGSRISGLLASLFVDDIEKKLLPSLDVRGYCRYVDDSFLLTRSSDFAKYVQTAFTSSQQHLNFTLEEPVDYRVCYLDLSISIKDGNLSIDFYRKASRSDIFINANSAMPTSSIISIARNERQRILSRCASQKVPIEEERFRQRLMANGFSDVTIEKVRRQYRKTPQQNVNDDFFYLRVPFVSDALDREIKKALRPLQCPIRLSHKNTNLRQLLNSRKNVETRICNFNWCLMRDSSKCFKTLVVYQMSCRNCQASYIGSTKRHLHIRTREHVTSKQSSVFRHTQNCHGEWVVNILAKGRDLVDLALKEGIKIRSLQPSLNNKEEVLSMKLVMEEDLLGRHNNS